MKKLCPKCGKQVALKNSFCPYCGEDISHAEVVKADLPPVIGKVRDLGSSAVTFVKNHKKPVIIATIAILLVVTIILASVLGTQAAKDIFKEKKVSKIEVGMTVDEVEAILGKADENNTTGATIFGNSLVYYESKFNKAIGKADKDAENALENADDFDSMFDDMDKAYKKVEKMKYKSIVIKLDYDKKVQSVALNKNTKYDEDDKYKSWESKELKSFELGTNSIGVGESLADREVTYTAKFKDGSYVYGLVASQKFSFTSKEEGVQTLTFSDDWGSYTSKINVMAHNVFVTSENTAMGSVKGGGYYAVGSDVTVTAMPNSGRMFDAWFDGNGNLVSYDSVYTFKATNNEADMNLTAKFVSDMKVNITLNTNISGLDVEFEGEGETTEGKSHTITVSLSEDETLFFEGWYLENEKVSSNRTYNFSARNGAYTAKFVKLNLQKNIDKAGIVNCTNRSGGSVGDEVTLTATTNDGYTWLGWYDGETKVSEGTDLTYTYVMTEENKTFTAKWGKVTLEKNLDEAGSINPLYGQYVVGDEVTLAATTNGGYTWLGWYDGETKVSEGTSLTYTYVMTEENNTFTAKWTYYTVTTDTNYIGAGTFTEYRNKKVTVGDEVTLTATTNNGYTWLGWYDGETKVSEGTNLTYAYVMTEENKTFTAKWIVCPVTLEKNVAEAGTVSGVEGATAVGGEVTITATSNIGYAWLGWYDGETKVSEGMSLTYTYVMTEENKTFTAKFEKCINHTSNADCICAKCGATAHTYENCICTNCGKTAHGLKEKGTYCRHNDIIYFGYYPQTIKADSVTVGDTADSDGYFLGSDGERYAKVTANPRSSEYKFSNYASVNSGTVYYFKVEPIKWRILEEKNGTAFILCESIIANHRYDDSSNNYANSEIRAWLNNGFYNKAFNGMQQKLIQITNVDNSVASTGYNSNPYACGNTNDKVFLLSVKEVTNSEYGFDSNYSNYDTARSKQPSDYSRATGVYMSTGNYYGNGEWWLRSPSYDGSSCARFVYYNGYANINSSVDFTDLGVVPALKIRLS